MGKILLEMIPVIVTVALHTQASLGDGATNRNKTICSYITHLSRGQVMPLSMSLALLALGDTKINRNIAICSCITHES
jgi:hypothetical protein